VMLDVVAGYENRFRCQRSRETAAAVVKLHELMKYGGLDKLHY
jgi:hypothetical protein